MAKYTTFTVPEHCAADVMALGKPLSADIASFKGVKFQHVGNGKFEVWDGNNGERAELAELATRVANKKTHNGAPATERQIAYIKHLIDYDPAAAMAVGASPDGVKIADNISKAAASRMISQMRGF